MSMALSDLRALPHVSVSQLKTFLQCPRKYRYQYIDRLEAEFRPIALAFGTAWHEAIGHWLVHSFSENNMSREKVRALFCDTLKAGVNQPGPPVLFEDQENLEQVLDLGRRMLDVFFEKVTLPEAVLGVEVPFVLELVHPSTGEVAARPLIGALDAVVVQGGTTSVWELKTGKKKWSADQKDFDPQPTAYSIAARELGYEADVVLLVTTKTTRPDVQVERLVRPAADERELAEAVLDVLRAVRVGVDYRVRSWACRSCPFATTCAS
jgi:CRISPR/Cas system-associated exonuclease Cas4 (RecB family)